MRTAVIVLARIVSLSLLIVGTSTVLAGRMAVVLAVMPRTQRPFFFTKPRRQCGFFPLPGVSQVARPRDGVDHRLRRGLCARAVALVRCLARIRRRD